MLEQKEVKRLRKLTEGLIKGNGSYDTQQFDFDNEIDLRISYGENVGLLKEKINERFPKISVDVGTLKKKYDVQEEKEEFAINQKLKEYEVEAEKEFEKTLDKIEQDKTTNLIEDVFYIPKQFAKMVALGNARGFLLYGNAGLGKTYSIIKAFREVNKKFVMLSGHITSMELYHFLFEHRKENILLDDVNILDNEQNLNMLKACLNDNSKIVQYHTSSKRLRVPNKFLFEGTIITILNHIPKNNESLKAVESRILNYNLIMDYKTKIKILYELSKQNYKNLQKEERSEIAKWIKQNTSPATENLNLRLLFTCYEIFRFDKDNWKKLASKLIVNDEDLQLIVKGLTEKEWCEISGRHRSTYYRLRDKLNLPKWKRKS